MGAVTLLLLASALTFYAAVGNPLDPFDRSWFSSANWAAANETERAHMSRDLVRHHLSIGMTKGRVLALLGSPPETNGSSEYLYPIDQCGHDQWDTAFVFIRFDPADRLSQASITGY